MTPNPDIAKMVDRFLAWKLPKDFNPDGGITFTPEANVGTPHPYRHEPMGTNLLNGVQAKAMLETVAGPAVVELACLREALGKIEQDFRTFHDTDKPEADSIWILSRVQFHVSNALKG